MIPTSAIKLANHLLNAENNNSADYGAVVRDTTDTAEFQEVRRNPGGMECSMSGDMDPQETKGFFARS